MRNSRLAPVRLMTLVAAAVAACGAPDEDAQLGEGDGAALAAAAPAGQQCRPIETRPPNAEGQTPAFEGQTRACAVTSNVPLEVTVVARGLVHPWAVEPLPGGDLLVTERPGRMRIVSARGTVGQPIAGLPPIDAGNQG